MAKRDKKVKKEPKKYITAEVILGILKTGALLGLAVTAPGVLRLFKDFDKKKPWDEYYPSTIERVAARLYRQGKVEISYQGGVTAVKISSKGKIDILKYDLSRLNITPQKNWDGKWRLVIFDISTKYNKIRNLIRGKLQAMGFYKFQESVFIYPYPCEKEIQYLREVLNVPHAIKLIRADKIENDRELRKIFKLYA